MRVRPVDRQVVATSLLFCVFTLLPSAARAASPQQSATLEISLRAVVAGRDPVPVQLVLEPVAGGRGDEERQARRLAAEVPGRLQLALDPASAWRIRAEAEGSWSPAHLVYVDPDGAEAAIAVWPAAELAGMVTAPPSEPPPAELSVRFESSPSAVSASAVPLSTEACTLAERHFRCRVPAGTLDLRLRSPASISHYLWDLPIAAGETRDLGTLTMRPGASVSGWVEIDGPGDPAEVVLTLLPQAGGHVTRERPRIDRRALSATVSARGFFHFEGVPPGLHDLTATLEGFAPARRALEVLERTEAVVREPLVLHPPLDLEVQIDPPRDPWDRAWKLQLSRISESRTIIEESWPLEAAASDGIWVKRALPAGRYSLRVGTPESSFQAVELSVEPGQGPVVVEIPLISVAGIVRLGDEPLAAHLVFGGRHRPVAVALDSGADGRFVGLLPRAGPWRVDVEAERPLIRRSIDVEVVDPEDGESEIVIEIPDTILAGTAVTEEGEPVASAIVSVSRRTIPPENGLQAFTDGDGRFEFSGFPAGLVAISAETRELSSGQALVFVTEDRESPPVRLVLRERRRLFGRVESVAGPVPGARLVFFPLGALDMGSQGATSGADGQFEVSLPAPAKEVLVTVLAPGFALSTERAAVDGGLLRISVGQDGGTLVLAGLSDPRSLEDAGRAPVVLHRGSFVPMALLHDWSLLHRADPADSDLRVAMVEPGDYTLCVAGWGDLRRAIRSQAGPAERCTTGYLPPGGELRLQSPSPARNAGLGD